MSSRSIYKNCNASLDKYFYSTEYLYFLISKILYDNGDSRWEDIYFYINENHPFLSDSINYSLFKRFVENNFLLLPKTRFRLHEEQTRCLTKVNERIDDIILMNKKDDNDIKTIFNASLRDNDINLLPIVAIQYLSDNILSREFFISKYYNFISNESKYQRDLAMYLNRVDPSYDYIMLSIFLVDKQIIEIMLSMGICNINHLKKFDCQILVAVFNSKMQVIIDSLANLDIGIKESTIAVVSNIFEGLSANEKDIIFRRNAIVDSKSMTLEEIGYLYGITSERIRQIEKKANKKIKNNSNSFKTIIRCLFCFLTGDDSFFSEESIFNYFENDLISKQLLFIITNNEDINIKYDREYGLIYDSDILTTKDIVNQTLSKFGNVIASKEIDDNLTRRIVKKHYNESNGKFKKKGLPQSYFLLDIIDNFFPHGYHISSEQDYKKLLDEYYIKFEESSENISPRAVSSALENNHYRLIDRGTYLNPSFCPLLPEDLLNRIIEYINNNSPIVYYSSIFVSFEKELREIGINNVFFLKGTLDDYLKDYNTKKNYIVVSNDDMNGNDAIIQSMKSFANVFSLDELKVRFPGVKEYVFTNIFYKESDLIWLSNKKFIYVDKIGYSPKIIDAIEQFVSDTMTNSGTKIVTASKIFARLSFINKDLLNELYIVKNQFDLFSVLKALFFKKLFFKRPLISCEPIDVNSIEDIVINYARTLDEFNKKVLDDFAAKRNMRSMMDYSKFMCAMSDDYVQVNIDTMVNKEKIDLSQDFITRVDDSLDLILSIFKDINTENFQGYYLLPICKIKWNKYLLKGIVDSYLSNKYFTIPTDKFYNKADYIIRRI